MNETLEFLVRPVVFAAVFVEQIGALNLVNLAAYTVYPDVAQIPADAWLPEPVPNPSTGTPRFHDETKPSHIT